MLDYPYYAWPSLRDAANMLEISLRDLMIVFTNEEPIPLRIHPADLYALNLLLRLKPPAILAELMLATTTTQELYHQLGLIFYEQGL